jgi:hypothetical protein
VELSVWVQIPLGTPTVNKEQKIEYLVKFKSTIDKWSFSRQYGNSEEEERAEKQLSTYWGIASEILKGLGYKIDIEITNDRGTKIGTGDLFADGFIASRDIHKYSNLSKIESYVLGAIEKLKVGMIPKDNVLPSLNTVINILNSFPDIVSRLKFRRKGKNSLEIIDEYDVQDVVYVMLKGIFPTLQYEDPTTKVGPNSSRADFTIVDLGIYIETKYISEKGKEKTIHDECLTDIQKYGKQENCQKIIFFVYDSFKCIDNQYAFKSGIGTSHISDGKEVEIITLIFN